ncbi:transcriptional regulator [Microbacterium mangrovi]|uniref:Transcriptional regulator n=1 Tax=Microbacterium mangrovi TaxID=1348253 RepID=A0A0B2ACE1_9MICO|nr:helix-turn-helix domain-containing protein [Microbacterium mangrovi]KHK99438.1 transcriptional regulator [Microbacterium mangrovi]
MTDPAPTLTARQPRAIHSALTVLEAVAELGAGTTAREVSVALGLPRATTYRLLNLLVQDEYLVRTPDLAGFALGAKVIQLAAFAAPARLPSAARDVVAELRADIRGGIHIARFDNGRVFIVDADPDFPLRDPLRLTREPERTAIGRLLLAASQASGPVVDAAAADLEQWGATRQMGELIRGYGCIAVPIRGAGGMPAGAVGYSGPSDRVADPGVLVRRLQSAAEQLGPLLS